MFISIAFVVSVLSVCYCEERLHYPQKEHQDQAVSSQSYKRDDVPLSYHFTAIHPQMDLGHEHHKSPRHHHIHRHQQDQHKKRVPKLQYAPVPLKTKENQDLFTEVHLPDSHENQGFGYSLGNEDLSAKSKEIRGNAYNIQYQPHLPQLVTEKPISYVPGYNFVITPNQQLQGHELVFNQYAKTNPMAASKAQTPAGHKKYRNAHRNMVSIKEPRVNLNPQKINHNSFYTKLFNQYHQPNIHQNSAVEVTLLNPLKQSIKYPLHLNYSDISFPNENKPITHTQALIIRNTDSIKSKETQFDPITLMTPILRQNRYFYNGANR